MLTQALLLAVSLLVSTIVNGQALFLEIDDFDLRLATQSNRSMAQGLVSPTRSSSIFHGGLDLSHKSGWYAGQWAPTMGIKPGSNLEVDSYLGYKHPFEKTLSYELGVIRYSYPKLSELNSQQIFAGLTILGTRFGAAFSDNSDRHDSTLFAELSVNQPFSIGVSMKYAAHELGTPVSGSNGGSVRVFNDWSVRLSRPWLGIDMNLIYSDSSLAGSECSAYSGQNSQCDGLLTFKAKRSFY